MRYVLVLLCALAGVSSANGTDVLVVESLNFSAFEAHTMAVHASPAGEHGGGLLGMRKQLLIKGVVSRAAQAMTVKGLRYADLDMLTASVQMDYCKREYVPAGESKFNAGRNISAVLGDYVPANLRIEVSYHVSSSRVVRSATRRTSFVCPNSMRE